MREPAEQFDRLRAALASRYRIVREIGRGGMALVYLADDLKHERRVAVKVFRPELAAALGPERFLREIQIAAVLAHPHILPLHDSGEADGFLFFVMPYVEGESLRDRLTRQGHLPVAEAVRIVGEIADGLESAHRKGIVHRDIKPENILFLGGHAVITDFGVATAVHTAGGTKLTQTGFSVGTPQYMSPEQALSEGEIDARSDIYALGCVLHEMLTGNPPFAGPNAQAILSRKLSEPLPNLALLRDTVSHPLGEAVRRALAQAPADRYGSAREFAAAVAVSSAPPPVNAARAPGRLSRAARAGILLVALIAVAGVVTVWRRTTAVPAGDAQRATAIAVLPFENLGPADDDYFAAGITDEIATRLGAVTELSVVPRGVAQRYARTTATMREIGRALGVDVLLIGSVRWAGNTDGDRRVRITLNLVQADDERQLWSTAYDREINDIFAVQSDIAGQVVARLGVTPRPAESTRLIAQPTESHEAYTLYLKGRYFWNKRTGADIQTALGYFQQAVDLDPGYALAWVGIADIWIARGWYGRLAPRETYPQAKSAVLRALEFDSTLAEAHTSLAHIHFQFDHDWVAAEREYHRAIELNPRYAVAHHWYGGFCSANGRHDEAIREAEMARSLDPLSPIIQTWIGLRYYFAGRPDTAIAEFRKAFELDPRFAPAHWHLGWAYEQAGRFAEGIAEAERALALDDGNLLYLASLGHAYARAGRTNDARAVLARLHRASATQHVSAYHVAAVYAALEDTTRALDWIERALEERSPWIGYLPVDPRLASLRAQPRFEGLLKRARLRP